jgi:hypothetical protein
MAYGGWLVLDHSQTPRVGWLSLRCDTTPTFPLCLQLPLRLSQTCAQPCGLLCWLLRWPPAWQLSQPPTLVVQAQGLVGNKVRRAHQAPSVCDCTYAKEVPIPSRPAP